LRRCDSGTILEDVRGKRVGRGAAVLALAALAAGAGAPAAAAAGADAVIADLEAQGYLVQINWVSGFDTKPLSSCTVVAVNNPDRSGAPPKSGDTIYVDVQCPNHIDGDSVGEFGGGLFLG
jgi:hypothetical protein